VTWPWGWAPKSRSHRTGAFFLFLFASPAWGQSAAIEDNSFFVEEAYNQNPGVVQHISNFLAAGPTRKDLYYSFTQEWPITGIRHQLSYTIPFTQLEGKSLGLGDVQLNYRYQLVAPRRWALAPRLTLILPTGSVAKQLGFGTVGVQVNVPLSIRVSRQISTHWNAGMTVLPAAEGSGGMRRSLWSYNLAASLIAPMMNTVQLMLETAMNFVATADSLGRVDRATVTILNPGVRFAMNLGRLQIVPGAAVPFFFRAGQTDTGLFFYLSFEHPFCSCSGGE